MWQRNSVYLIYRKYYLYYDHYGILGINALSKKFSFLLLTVITMLDGNEEVKLWLACVAGGNVHSRKVLEEDDCCKDVEEWGRDTTKTLTCKNNSAG